MNQLDRMEIKVLIDISLNEKEADRIIEEKTGFTTYREKMAFLMGMYDTQIAFKNPKDYSEDDYWALLYVVVFKKMLWKQGEQIYLFSLTFV